MNYLETQLALTKEDLLNIGGGEIPMSLGGTREYGSSLSSSFSAICDFFSDFSNGFSNGFNAARH